MTDDPRIERALRALTSVEAPDGLEERILRRLVAHKPQARAGWRWMVSAVAVAACTVMALVVGLRHPVQVPVVAVPVARTVAVTKPSVTGEVVVAGERHRPVRVRAVKAVVVQEASFPAPAAPLTEQERLLVRLAEARKREATQQIEVATVARKPKHEAALTHEEMLLVAVSHVRQDAVIDALDPVRRAEAEAREKQEFKAYVRQKDGGSDETRP